MWSKQAVSFSKSANTARNDVGQKAERRGTEGRVAGAAAGEDEGGDRWCCWRRGEEVFCRPEKRKVVRGILVNNCNNNIFIFLG